MARYNAMTDGFEEVTIFDKPALFTPVRIDRNTIPNGFHLYEVRHDDNCQGGAVQIAKSIVVNHWGSLITRDEINLPADGYLDIEPDDLNYGTGVPEYEGGYYKMAKFGVNVTETSYGFIEIEADSLEEARSKAEDEYYKGNIHWTSSEFISQDATE